MDNSMLSDARYDASGLIILAEDGDETISIPVAPGNRHYDALIAAGIEIAAYVATITWDDIRNRRSDLLRQCDWTQLSDAPLSAGQRDAWAVYRQALRDIPAVFDLSGPTSVVWPSLPA